MLKKIEILGKWYSPENDLEKVFYKAYQQAQKKKNESKSD